MKNINTITELKALIKRFHDNEEDFLKVNYNEAQLRSDYLNPLFELLGWDIENKAGLPQNLREVILETKVQVGEQNKKPDYAFRVRGMRKYFVEAKKPSVNILEDAKSAFQLRRYGWSAKMSISILTNFKDLIIYDCRGVPKEGDNPRVGRIHHYSYEQYEQKFEEIYNLISKEALFSGALDKAFEDVVAKRDVIQIDDYFLSQIDSWRQLLAAEIVQNNKSISNETLNYLVQTFLNRLVFLRICEDRNLETYESLLKINKSDSYNELLKLFKNADERYNSGLFDFTRGILLENINIGDSVILEIIKELYYPRSPYIFSVVESNVLGDIYELFLKKEVVISEKGSVSLIEKPEASHNRSIVFTPKEIVQEIVHKTLNKQLGPVSRTSIKSLKAIDICCGSGSFLLEAYQYLLDELLNWYIENDPDKHKGLIYKGEDDLWFLSLKEKRELLLQTIHGVDIDPNAVEVTKFGLLIKLLENENAQTIVDYNDNNEDKALPPLEHNIQCGNSLIDEGLFQFRKASSLTSEEIFNLKPFNWDKAFHEVMTQGGFDVIIGNPPYTRIQTMNELYPIELTYYQSKYSPYVSCKKDNFDKYYLFIERGIQLLKNNGRLGYIAPHKFTKIKAGTLLRDFISSNKYVEEITNFGKEQVFGVKATTYTCILILRKYVNKDFILEPVTNYSEWRHKKNRQTFTISSKELTADPWVFIYGPLKDILTDLSVLSTKLQDYTDIFVGLQTSNDKVYIVKPKKIDKSVIAFEDQGKNLVEIEASILRPAIYDLELEPFQIPKPNCFIIFPYNITDGKAVLIPQSEMKKNYPKAWVYLNRHKKELGKRSIQNVTLKTWYCYGRSQSLTKFQGTEHLIVKVLSLSPTFCYDKNNSLFTGGGNGPYYGISIKKDQNIDILYVQGVLNSPLLDLYVHSRSSIFRAGYFSYGKLYIEQFPFAVPDLSDVNGKACYNGVIKLVSKLNNLVSKEKLEVTPSRKESLEHQIINIKNELNNIIYDIYGIASEKRTILKNFEV